jgi:hypothetical protein
MPKKFFRPPEKVVNEWPEIFEDMYMSTMPLYYTKSMQIKFDNGRIWQLNIQELVVEHGSDELSTKLLETFKEYQQDITGVDFEIDIDKLKKDIKKSIKKIL